MMFQLSFPRLFGQESGTIWQYPSTGNEHQVGKDYPPRSRHGTVCRPGPRNEKSRKHNASGFFCV